MKKITRFFAILLCMPLCACNVQSVREVRSKSRIQTIKNEELKSIAEDMQKGLEENNYKFDLGKNIKNKDEFYDNFEKSKTITAYKGDISAEVYEYREYMGFPAIKDGDDIYLDRLVTDEIAGCEEIYSAIRQAGFIYTGYEDDIPEGQFITCSNKEFAAVSVSGAFDISCTENMPVSISIFVKDNRVSDIVVFAAKTEGRDTLSNSNINEIRSLLTKLGYDDESGAVTEEIVLSQNKRSYSTEVNGISMEGENNVEGNGYIFNCVLLKNKAQR